MGPPVAKPDQALSTTAEQPATPCIAVELFMGNHQVPSHELLFWIRLAKVNGLVRTSGREGRYVAHSSLTRVELLPPPQVLPNDAPVPSIVIVIAHGMDGTVRTVAGRERKRGKKLTGHYLAQLAATYATSRQDWEMHAHFHSHNSRQTAHSPLLLLEKQILLHHAIPQSSRTESGLDVDNLPCIDIADQIGHGPDEMPWIGMVYSCSYLLISRLPSFFLRARV